jgi:dTDP-4-dehydrorhamnose reductase
MKVLIIGAGGQLGSELLKICPKDCKAAGMDVPEIDITDSADVERALAVHGPDWVINCAAYTQVDKAESEPDAAHAVNCTGPANLARAVKANKARMVHISTDFVFSGDQSRPYKPDDRPDPKSVYGRTKLAGEQAVTDILGNEALIIRTAWLYAAHGNNFVKTMICLMKEKERLGVVDDQVGTPCWANGLAQAVWAAVEKNSPVFFTGPMPGWHPGMILPWRYRKKQWLPGWLTSPSRFWRCPVANTQPRRTDRVLVFWIKVIWWRRSAYHRTTGADSSDACSKNCDYSVVLQDL